MSIRYSTRRKITSGSFQGFFEGWPTRPSAATIRRLLKKSDEVIFAVDDRTGQIIGFITAITDGALSAYIPFVEVLPAYRRRGIGRKLVGMMLKRLRSYYMIDLRCDPDVLPFYTKIGMKSAVGASVRNYRRLKRIS